MLRGEKEGVREASSSLLWRGNLSTISAGEQMYSKWTLLLSSPRSSWLVLLGLKPPFVRVSICWTRSIPDALMVRSVS